MRALFVLPLLLLLSACVGGMAASDVAIGGATAYALYGDDLEEVTQEELQDPKTYRDAVPPQAKQGAHRVANNFRDGVRATSRRMKEWWFYDPESEKLANLPVPPSYCYTVLQDIVCYSGPMPGWEHRLVGYQGTLAARPPRVMTEPLPKLAAEGDIPAEARLKAAAPVFKEIPEEVEKEKEEGIPPAGGSAQETLPDPLMSPQL